MAKPGDLGNLSQILLDLYSANPAESAQQFRVRALEQLETRLSFTGAAWAHGVMTIKGAVFHDILVRGLSPTFADAVRATADADPTSHKMAAASGQSFIHAQEDYPVEIRQLAGEPDDLNSSLEGMIADESTGVFSSVCLFRNSKLPPFNETERELHQSLLPHWIAALSRRIIDEAFARTRGHALGSFVAAVASSGGALEAVSEKFAALLRTEWPQWPGGNLPSELLKLATNSEAAFTGEHLVAKLTRLPERILICARESRRIDALGRRERQVADLLSSGLALKAVAMKLGLSPSTVENHRDHIYRKLGISSRPALIAALRDAHLF